MTRRQFNENRREEKKKKTALIPHIEKDILKLAWDYIFFLCLELSL